MLYATFMVEQSPDYISTKPPVPSPTGLSLKHPPPPVLHQTKASQALLAIASTSSAAIFVQQYRESQRRLLVFHQWNAEAAVIEGYTEPITVRYYPETKAKYVEWAERRRFKVTVQLFINTKRQVSFPN